MRTEGYRRSKSATRLLSFLVIPAKAIVAMCILCLMTLVLVIVFPATAYARLGSTAPHSAPSAYLDATGGTPSHLN